VWQGPLWFSGVTGPTVIFWGGRAPCDFVGWQGPLWFCGVTGPTVIFWGDRAHCDFLGWQGPLWFSGVTGPTVILWGDRAHCDFLLHFCACICLINKPKHVAPVGKQPILSQNTFVMNDTRVRFLHVPLCLYFCRLSHLSQIDIQGSLTYSRFRYSILTSVRQNVKDLKT